MRPCGQQANIGAGPEGCMDLHSDETGYVIGKGMDQFCADLSVLRLKGGWAGSMSIISASYVIQR
jgi:hypothetical protein